MSETPERRNAKRVAIRLPVVYRGPDNAPKRGTTENVSRRGMLLVAQDQAVEGTRLRIAVTGLDGREREIVGEVVRSTPDGSVAVSIAESDAAEIDAIVEPEEPLREA
ncbi:MAG: PilZ domain-containing protein [Candidatus Eremiobacteraeota bacterium]|nr:PilZ domain-containing protein [Candidatus Eremiobacteraeota bacterium]